MSLLVLERMSVQFGALRALESVSLSIARGEFVVLVGPNGSGKTTLLRALHGLQPGSGIRRLADGATRQAMVFQHPFLLRLSVANNVRLALWQAGVPRALWPQRTAAALRRVGLEGLDGRTATALSGGQQQRLAIARAWAVQPELLFLDEPTASLDPAARREVETLLAGFAADGMTMVMSTHSLGQARRLASRVVYLEGGVVHADLPRSEFFDQRLQGRARQFLDEELP